MGREVWAGFGDLAEGGREGGREGGKEEEL